MTLYLLKDSFAQAFGGLFSSSFVDIRLKLHPMVFALAAAVCIATTLIT